MLASAKQIWQLAAPYFASRERRSARLLRVAMDIPLFIQHTLHVTVGQRSLGPQATGILTAIASLAAFALILWNLSEEIPFVWRDQQIHVPGYLLWAGLVFATLSTGLTHRFGRELIPLRFNQQRYEADFRYDLVRVREHSEQIALLRGEALEERRLMGRFRLVAENWHRLMTRQVKLSGVIGTINGVTVILPSLLLAPAFFAGIAIEPVSFAPGERVLVTGPTGSRKSTTFRALGGIWPYATGELRIPEDASVMVLPQRPYISHGTVAQALAFPHQVERWTRTEYAAALDDVGGHAFVPRLEERNRWDARPSGGEQQRLAIARALLQRPDYLFLDEATAGDAGPVLAEARRA